MVRGLKDRILPQLAYRYHLRNKTRSSGENWELAIKLLLYIKKRKSLVQRIVK